jgi:hypothetical protein
MGGGGFSAEEEKEPSLCPEKAALLSRAECDQERDKQNDKTGAKSWCGPSKTREALAPWLITGGPKGSRGYCDFAFQG